MKGFTRREVLNSLGLAAGAGLLACRAAEVPAGEDGRSAASQGRTFVRLDPAMVADRAYRIYPEGACMYATFGSIVSSLGELMGEPYRSFPVDMTRATRLSISARRVENRSNSGEFRYSPNLELLSQEKGDI